MDVLSLLAHLLSKGDTSGPDTVKCLMTNVLAADETKRTAYGSQTNVRIPNAQDSRYS